MSIDQHKSNHQLAMEYNLKQSVIGKNLLKYALLDNDRVALTKVIDTRSTGKLIIPSFITDIGNNLNDGINYSVMIYPLSACKFRHIIVENQPNTEFNASRLCGYMRSTEIKLEFRHPECVTSLKELFKGCSDLTQVDLSKLDIPNVKSIDRMFSLCSSLKSLDISHFNTQNLESMRLAFLGCESLTKLDISHFNTSKLVSMEKAFYDCSGLKSLVLGNIDTSKLENIAETFAMCASLEYLDLSKLDLSSVKDMSYAFTGCKKLRSINTNILYVGAGSVLSGAFMGSGIAGKVAISFRNNWSNEKLDINGG